LLFLLYMTPNNPILKTLKENDIVLFHIPSNTFTRSAPIRQIIKLKNLKFQPSDDKYHFDWLNFEGEVLYTTERVHSENPNLIFGNCLSIIEKLNSFLVEKYVKDFMMFPPSENQLSDEELEFLKNRLQ